MSDFFERLIDSLVEFYEDFIYGKEAWWLPLAVLAAMYTLFLIVIRFNSKRFPFLQNHYILSGVIVAAACAAFLLIAFYCYLWSSSSYYVKHRTEFIHLLALSLVLLAAIMAFLIWRKKFERERLRELVAQPLTQNEQNRFYNQAQKDFNKSKLWLLLPALGFVMLTAFLYRSHNVVSFILDNSSSMDAHIEQGKESLIRTIQELDDNTDIIIGWLTQDKPPKTSIAEIITENDDRRLLGQHSFFTNKQQAQDYLADIPGTPGTPLYEAIWSNLLFAKAHASNRIYGRRLLVIVTDGEDNGVQQEELQNFLCSQPDFAEFFTNVACINLGGNESNNFFQKAQDCGYRVEDGSDKETYSIALDTILHEYKNNWSFIIWLAICYVALTLIAMTVQPVRN